MRWHSTPESIQQGKPSILAILETLTAIVVSLLIAYHINSVRYIAVGACIAPLLLLRTEKSSQLALYWSEKFFKLLFSTYFDIFNVKDTMSSKGIKKRIFILISLILHLILIISIFFIKIFTTTIIVIRYPLNTLNYFSFNWRQIVLCTDFYTIPELIPGLEIIDKERKSFFIYRFSILSEVVNIVVNDYRRKSSLRPVYAKILNIFTILFFLFPCYIYRWSLKSTSLIWSPLVWILREPPSGNLSFRLDQITKAAIYRASRYYSFFVIIIFSIKMYIWVAWQQIAETWQKIPGINTLNAYLVPQEIPLWHLCAVANALGAWLIYFMADWFLQKYRHEQLVPENLIEKVIHIHTTIARPLSFYTIACSLYITVNLGLRMKWPPLGAKLFPWQ